MKTFSQVLNEGIAEINAFRNHEVITEMDVIVLEQILEHPFGDAREMLSAIQSMLDFYDRYRDLFFLENVKDPKAQHFISQMDFHVGTLRKIARLASKVAIDEEQAQHD